MNIRSFNEGEKECSSGKGLSHEAKSMVDELINVPLQEKCLSYLVVSCKDCWLLAVELSIGSLGSDGIRVIIQIRIVPSASSVDKS